MPKSAPRPSGKTDPSAPPRRVPVAALIALALAALTLIAYSPVFSAGFVNYDDHRYLTANPHVRQGLTADSIAWAFTTFDVANWHPLTWLSHLLDVQLFGLERPGAHHAVNLALHALNALLAFRLLLVLTGAMWRSAVVAALFALHPLHVESVAWVSERKDALSACFGLLSMLAYARQARSPSATHLFLSLALFAMSLLAKPMLVTLPFVLLLLDFWPLKRFSPAAIAEKIPFLILSIASSVVTMIAQTRGGAVSGLDAVSLPARLANAVAAYGIYLRQTIWPLDLGPLYPFPRGGWPPAAVIAAAVALIVISTLVMLVRKRSPALAVGWLWFLGTLVPVIGLVQIGSASHADRYTYLPLIGVFMMIAWAIPDAAFRNDSTRRLAAIAAAGILLALAMVTNVQAGYWSDSITLSGRAIAVTSANPIAHFNLGNAYRDAGRLDEAIDEFREAESLAPNRFYIPFNLGNALARQPDGAGGAGGAAGAGLDEAIAAYERALRLNPTFADIHLALGNALARRGRLQEAADHFAQTLQIDPFNIQARLSNAATLRSLGKPDEAKRNLIEARQLAAERGRADLVAIIQRQLDDLAAPKPAETRPSSSNP